MRLLAIGGTRFVGRHVVEAALAAGHEVTVFHRGVHGAALFPEVEHRLGDRDGDLGALARGRWDATIDVCAYRPRQVHALADVLGERAGRYVLVSTVSVYDRPPPGFGADAPLVPPAGPDVVEVTGATYGPLKVACEQAAVARFGPRTLVVRPTYVIGPHDHTGRFPWWVRRIARGGRVLAPGPADAPMQVIDGRDLGAWTVELVTTGRAGAVNAVGPAHPLTWGGLLDGVVDTVGPPGTELVWVDAVFLTRSGLDAQDLPLWSRSAPDRAYCAADPAPALAAGLQLRPLPASIVDTLAWSRRAARADIGADAVTDVGQVGLDSAHELALLRRWADHARTTPGGPPP